MIHSSSKMGDEGAWPSSLRSKDPYIKPVAGSGRTADASLRRVDSTPVLARFARIGLVPPNPNLVRVVDA
jgi:hypothetical protein